MIFDTKLVNMFLYAQLGIDSIYALFAFLEIISPKSIFDPKIMMSNMVGSKTNKTALS